MNSVQSRRPRRFDNGITVCQHSDENVTNLNGSFGGQVATSVLMSALLEVQRASAHVTFKSRHMQQLERTWAQSGRYANCSARNFIRHWVVR
uniref:Uncharacterized protein n=1 Tax=Trichuris muris TaxID=70415 RepID=A0A5S6Q944_TRIMR